MDFGTLFPEGSPLAIVKYWSNYADSAEIPVSGEIGWEILRSGTDEREIFACSHPDSASSLNSTALRFRMDSSFSCPGRV